MKKLWQKILDWTHLISFVGGFSLLLGGIFFIFPEGSVPNALAPEFVSIGVTILIVDKIVERQQDAARKRELLLNMGGKSNDFAVTAARALRKEEWLFDGSWRTKILVGLN